MTTQTKNIYQRLNDVKKEVRAIQKEKKTVNGKYTFVSHDAVVRELSAPMVEAGIMMIPSVDKAEQEVIKTVSERGESFTISVLVHMSFNFINVDNPEDRFVTHGIGHGIDNQDKAIGKAISYAMKYALLKTFMLETGDDVEKDHINYVPKSTEKSKPATQINTQTIPRLSLEQIDEIMRLVGKCPEGLNSVFAHFKCESLVEIPSSEFEKIIRSLKKKIESKSKIHDLCEAVSQ